MRHFFGEKVMARLEDLREHFTPLTWPLKVAFVEAYRTKRHNDLNTVQEFDLAKAIKTKSTKVREKKEPKTKTMKKITQAELLLLSPEQQALLKQLGIC
jgi:hypothetical protein